MFEIAREGGIYHSTYYVLLYHPLSWRPQCIYFSESSRFKESKNDVKYSKRKVQKNYNGFSFEEIKSPRGRFKRSDVDQVDRAQDRARAWTETPWTEPKMLDRA